MHTARHSEPLAHLDRGEHETLEGPMARWHSAGRGNRSQRTPARKMAGGGQDRACALGWGEEFRPNRPKTVAHNPTIPHKVTSVAKEQGAR